MAKADPRNFYLNTDYEMDKIIYFTEGEIEAMQTKNIPHALGFAPLVFGICAFNSDFSDPRSLPFEQMTQDNTIATTLYGFTDKVQIGYGNYADNPPKLYYRIYGFEPSNSRAKIGSTSKHANEFILNTDYNYCKLYKKGIINGDTTITHGLGYLPQVLAWKERNDGSILPVELFSIDATLPGSVVNYVKVTNSDVIFYNTGKVHYRIYYDEA